MKAYDMYDAASSLPQNVMMGAEELSVLSRCISVELEIVDTSPCLMPNKALGNMMSARKSKVRFLDQFENEIWRRLLDPSCEHILIKIM